MRTVERQVLLQVLDSKWREHLYEMDYLKEGIGLRAMGQRDPLTEYQREGYQLFEAMTDTIKEQSVQVLFRVEKRLVPADGEEAPAPAVPQRAASSSTSTAPAAGGSGLMANMGALTYSGPAEDGSGRRRPRRRPPRSRRPKPTAAPSPAPRRTRRARVAQARSTRCATARTRPRNSSLTQRARTLASARRSPPPSLASAPGSPRDASRRRAPFLRPWPRCSLRPRGSTPGTREPARSAPPRP